MQNAVLALKIEILSIFGKERLSGGCRCLLFRFGRFAFILGDEAIYDLCSTGECEDRPCHVVDFLLVPLQRVALFGEGVL